ncbi:MAG TPA: MaoC family dehydratase [Acidimicrobiia bacterium]|nr:MaoC family dehydratase [Acidimicrobiia bacterium]
MTAKRVPVGGPWFEEFKLGQVFDDAPSVTLTAGLATLHQALCGDRLRLPLDAELSRAVTGASEPLAHPNLVCHVAIGQTTAASQRVRGNLFYRGLQLLRPVHLGDTLTTRTEVVGLKQNRPKPGRPATGMVALRMQTDNQRGERVLDFWRCPMIPLRDTDADTGHADSFDDIPSGIDLEQLAGGVPDGWRLDVFAERAGRGGVHFADVEPGTVYDIEGRDTVTSAPELVRATLNLAATHTDPAVGAYGRRLVYGGHTISFAGAHATRALPNLVTILAWHSCDHTGPVFEGDVLKTELSVEAVHPLGTGGMVDLRAVVHAERVGGEASGGGGPGTGEGVQVLDWRFVGLMA